MEPAGRDMAVDMDTTDPVPARDCLGADAAGPWAIETEGPRLSAEPELTPDCWSKLRRPFRSTWGS